MSDQQGTWGGARPGAGNPDFKPKWKSGKTTVIRVPEAIADEVLTAARQIDDGIAVTHSSESVIDAATLLNHLKPYLSAKPKLTLSRLEEILESVTTDIRV